VTQSCVKSDWPGRRHRAHVHRAQRRQPPARSARARFLTLVPRRPSTRSTMTASTPSPTRTPTPLTRDFLEAPERYLRQLFS